MQQALLHLLGPPLSLLDFLHVDFPCGGLNSLASLLPPSVSLHAFDTLPSPLHSLIPTGASGSTCSGLKAIYSARAGYLVQDGCASFQVPRDGPLSSCGSMLDKILNTSP
eukprot:3972110-Amphidinium_carterae.1